MFITELREDWTIIKGTKFGWERNKKSFNISISTNGNMQILMRVSMMSSFTAKKTSTIKINDTIVIVKCKNTLNMIIFGVLLTFHEWIQENWDALTHIRPKLNSRIEFSLLYFGDLSKCIAKLMLLAFWIKREETQ